MLTELAIIIILILLALSFYAHYGTHKNIRILFDEKEVIKNQIQVIQKSLKKHD